MMGGMSENHFTAESDIKEEGVTTCGICGAPAHLMKWGDWGCGEKDWHVGKPKSGKWYDCASGIWKLPDEHTVWHVKVKGKDWHGGFPHKFKVGVPKVVIYPPVVPVVFPEVLAKPVSKWGERMKKLLEKGS